MQVVKLLARRPCLTPPSVADPIILSAYYLARWPAINSPSNAQDQRFSLHQDCEPLSNAYFGRDEQLIRFHSNSDYGFTRTPISVLSER